MSAQPVDDSNPDDPVEILRLLPEIYRAQFLGEYDHVVDEAHRPEHFRELQKLLRLWWLRALAYTSPGYEDRLAAARDGDPAEFFPAAQVVRGWPGG